MIIMALQVALKKPLCIDSTIVYKIDNIEAENTETVYSCNQFKRVPFSVFFYDHLNNLQSRLLRLEIILDQISISGRVTIAIDHVKNAGIRELRNGIQISADLLDTNQLEKKLLQFVLKNRLNLSDDIILETLADFFMGDEKYQNLISEAWGNSFSEISFLEKRKILRLLARQLTALQKNDDLESIEKLKDLLLQSGHQELANSFSKNLKKLGFYKKSELAGLRLDIIMDNPLLQGAAITELVDLAKHHQNIKIAIKNKDGLLLLPSKLKISGDLEKNLFTKYRIIFNNQVESKSIINQYINNSESLILIHANTAKLAFSPMFTSGIKDFFSLNKQLDFIQIHLPSYRLIYKDLSQIANYFEFVRVKKLSQSEHRVLGWSRTEWSKDLQAFRPIANYDVIQYFRIN